MPLASLQKRESVHVAPPSLCHCYSAVRSTLPATSGPCRSIEEQTKSQTHHTHSHSEIELRIGKILPQELSGAINLGLIHKTFRQLLLHSGGQTAHQSAVFLPRGINRGFVPPPSIGMQISRSTMPAHQTDRATAAFKEAL